MHQIARPQEVLHVASLDQPALMREFQELERVLQLAGVDVVRVTHGTDEPEDAAFNLMYLRDVMLATPHGLVVASMGHPVRQAEPAIVADALRTGDTVILGRIRPPGSLEGADALWCAAQDVCVAVGNRTNMEGRDQLQRLLEPFGVVVSPVRAPIGSLHLLGAVQLIDERLALVRTETVADDMRVYLSSRGIETVEISEKELSGEPHAMNFVVLNARRVIMRRECPAMRRRLESLNVEVIEVPAEQLIRGGGGLACAVGVMRRAAMTGGGDARRS